MVSFFVFVVIYCLEDPSDFIAFVYALLIILLNVQDSLLTSLKFTMDRPSLLEVPMMNDDVGLHKRLNNRITTDI